MSTFALPAAGIALKHELPDSQSTESPRSTVRLNLNSKDIEELLQAIKNGRTPRFKTGKIPEISLGTRTIALSHISEKFPQELFSRPTDSSKPAYFAGKLSHTFEVRQAQAAIAGADEALEKLKNNLKQFHEDRTPKHSGLMNHKLLKPQHKPSPLGGFGGSRPSSPFLGGLSPRPGPTSAPLLSGQSKEDKIRLAAIKIPVIHLLAVHDHTIQELVKVLRVRKHDLDQVLGRVASDTEKGSKKLRDRAYRDLDVWKFPYKSQNDRQAAIDHAVSAYDRQRIDKTDKLWQMLLAEEDRGQNIYLSRLNFDKPLMTGNLTPKLPERSTDGGSTEGKSSKSAASEQSAQKGKAPVAKTTGPHNKVKPTAEKLAKSLKNFGQAKASEKSVKKPSDNSDKRNVKYKSSEKIEDSDEEASTVPTLAATAATSRKTPKSTPTPSQEKPLSNLNRATLHKSQLSSSSGSSSEIEPRKHKAPATMVKTRGGKDTASTHDTVDSSSSTHLPAPKPQSSSRPRNGSSPAKPSPLGSSPPTNSRDVETSSNSSKSTALSSAPSSPPSTSSSSQPLSRSRSALYDAQNTEKATNGVKRKADTQKGGTPAKKQQLSNGIAERERFNALPKAPSDETDHLPRTKRASPISDSSSGTERVFTRESLIEETRKFHKYYSKYKDLYETIEKVVVLDRDDAEVDQVWKMHSRLAEMKKQIWSDYAKLERRGKG